MPLLNQKDLNQYMSEKWFYPKREDIKNKDGSALFPLKLCHREEKDSKSIGTEITCEIYPKE